MIFEKGQSVIVLDSETKPAGSGIIIEESEGQLYKVSFTNTQSNKKENVILPAHRLLMHTPLIMAVEDCVRDHLAKC
ncbi:MAG TPA: hypothetical protein VK772_00500 [Puia sp.]|jgi:hypothetical protein|nr:hypothetical protein [Puia sp.]